MPNAELLLMYLVGLTSFPHFQMTFLDGVAQAVLVELRYYSRTYHACSSVVKSVVP